MSKLVSFLIPTRNACIESLTQAVEHIVRGDEGTRNFEILLKVDEDDHERIAIGRELIKNIGKVVVSPRGIGYSDMSRFIDELVAVADSKWCWLHDDDAYLEGDWYSPLAEVDCDPVHGPALNPEFYILGESYYRNGHNPPGMLMPTEFVKKLQHTTPVDDQWLSEAKRLGWHIRQLPGCHYHHDGRPRV